MAVLDSVLVFLVGLFIGGIGIHYSAVLFDIESKLYDGLIAAFLGSIVWSVVGFFFSPIPVVGTLITVIAWMWVINERYPCGWAGAAAIAVFSWLIAGGILYVLAGIGLGTFEAIGIPKL